MVIRTKNNEFVKTLNEIHKNEGVVMSTEQAKDDASKNLPSDATKSPIHFKFLTSFYNRLVVDFKGHCENSMEQYHALKDIAQFKKLTARLKEKLVEVRNNLRIRQRAFENLKSFLQKIQAHRKAMVGIILLSTCEAIFASTSFQLFTENLLFSLVIGLCFATALYYSAVIGAKVLKKTATPLQFFGVLFLILLLIGSVFYTLGHFRLVFIDAMSDGGSTSYNLSAIEFMGIQLFFYTCAILLKYFYMPDKFEVEQYHKWRESKREIKGLKKEECNIEQQIEVLEKELNHTLVTRKTLLTQSADIERKIDALYRDAYEHYVKTNIHHRSDNSIPKCFENDCLPLLTMYFQDTALLEFNDADLNNG